MSSPAPSGWTATNSAPCSSQAGLGSARDHALISLLALNGLRISEALNADVEKLDMDRGHRTLAIVRKGGKHVTSSLRSSPAPPTSS
jgi:integrase